MQPRHLAPQSLSPAAYTHSFAQGVLQFNAGVSTGYNMASAASMHLGPVAMPSARSHKAPFFDSKNRDPIKVFLHEYEDLADTHWLTYEEKVKTILHYISPELRDLWQLLDGFPILDWAHFKHKVEEIYADRNSLARYSKKKLLDYT